MNLPTSLKYLFTTYGSRGAHPRAYRRGINWMFPCALATVSGALRRRYRPAPTPTEPAPVSFGEQPLCAAW